MRAQFPLMVAQLPGGVNLHECESLTGEGTRTSETEGGRDRTRKARKSAKATKAGSVLSRMGRMFLVGVPFLAQLPGTAYAVRKMSQGSARDE